MRGTERYSGGDSGVGDEEGEGKKERGVEVGGKAYAGGEDAEGVVGGYDGGRSAGVAGV